MFGTDQFVLAVANLRLLSWDRQHCMASIYPFHHLDLHLDLDLDPDLRHCHAALESTACLHIRDELKEIKPG